MGSPVPQVLLKKWETLLLQVALGQAKLERAPADAAAAEKARDQVCAGHSMPSPVQMV